jgi:hypothetical protein
MMVWQSAERNEWATAIPEALSVSDLAASATAGIEPFWQAPFALADPSVVEAILHQAGFSDVGFTEVREPVYYGPDVDTAYDIVCSFKNTQDVLARLDERAAERARDQLRGMLAGHLTGDGVLFDSRAWIVSARSS